MLIQVIPQDWLRKKHYKIKLLLPNHTFLQIIAQRKQGLLRNFLQEILRNVLYQYTICTIPKNKVPANMNLAEFRNNQNLRMETLTLTLQIYVAMSNRGFTLFPS